MSNKTQLQINNTNLASILSVAQNLPTGDSFKHGLFVWKKYEYNQEIAIENPSITVTPIKGEGKFSIQSNFDLNLLNEYNLNFYDFFDGFTGDSHTLTKASTGNKLTYEYTLLSGVLTSITALSIIDENNGFFIASSTSLSDFSIVPTLTRATKTILKEESKEFIDYVISDTESAYPDGGEKDGYWYERVSDGLTPEMFGLTKMAIDKITWSTRTMINNKSVNHTLGVEPKIAMMFCDFTSPISNMSSTDLLFILQIGKAFGTSSISTLGGALLKKSSTTNGLARTNYGFTSMSGTTCTIQNNEGVYSCAGVEYTLITMA